MNGRKSSRCTKFIRHGCVVSAVNSYGLPITTASKPRSSPARAIRRMMAFPPPDVAESLACPWQSMKTPRGLCPSTKMTARDGLTVACFNRLKTSSDSLEGHKRNCRNADHKSDIQWATHRARSWMFLIGPERARRMCTGNMKTQPLTGIARFKNARTSHHGRTVHNCSHLTQRAENTTLTRLKW